MSGAGNLFTMIDNRTKLLNPEQAALFAPQLCVATQVTGRKTEGLLLLQNSNDDELDFEVLFFNPDGSSSMMCGNGARCAIRFAQHIGAIATDNSSVRFRMAGELYSAVSAIGDIEVSFPPPSEIRRSQVISAGALTLTVDYINVSSDHVILEEDYLRMQCIEDSQKFSFLSLAPLIRSHNIFPKGANVNLYRVREDVVYLQTFERGVEAITGACGTGALATAVSIWLRNQQAADTFSIIPPSGEKLEVKVIHNAANEITALALRGDAKILGTATKQIPD